MEKPVFTDAMAYECDHCPEPWNCIGACEKLRNMAIAGGVSR